jgi:RNA polymerase sigma factor (sigma-70 family)
MSDFAQLRNSLSTYIKRYPPPSKEQNSDWLNKLNTLEKTSKEYKNIRDRMVLCNGGFAMKYVMKYRIVLNDDVSVMDLFQEATLGIIETIDDFNIKEGTSFTTYAHFHIKKRIIDFIKKNKLVKAPRDIARNLKHVEEVRCKLLTELCREPSTKEIVRQLKKDKEIIITDSMVDSVIILLDLNSGASSDSFINEYNEQTVQEDEDFQLFKLMESNIESRIKRMPELIQKAIRFRFGVGTDSPHTLEEVNYILDLDEETQNVIILTPESDKHFLT